VVEAEGGVERGALFDSYFTEVARCSVHSRHPNLAAARRVGVELFSKYLMQSPLNECTSGWGALHLKRWKRGADCVR
jgi:hypothetical protein